MYFTFAWRYFKAKKSTNAINIIAWVTVSVIAFATCCQVLVLSVFNGFEDLVKSLYSSFYTDIKIIPASGKTFILDSAQLKNIQQQPYINYTSLIAEEKGLLKNPEQDVQATIYLKGVDENYIHVNAVPAKTRGKFNLGTLDEPGIIVGSGIENAALVSIDDPFTKGKLVIILPKKNVTGNDPLNYLSEGNVTATGVFTIQQDFDNKYAISNIDFVKMLMNLKKDEYSSLEIQLKPNTDLKEVQQKLTGLLGTNFIVQTRYQQNMSLYNTMRLEKWAIYAVLTLILIIAAFNMISALTMLVLEKQKDISVLLSMGATRMSIQKIFLTEGLLLGFIGSAIGIALASIICLLQIKFKLIKLKGGSFLIDYFPVKLIATDFILVAITAFLIAFTAAWFPARKAAKQAFELR